MKYFIRFFAFLVCSGGVFFVLFSSSIVFGGVIKPTTTVHIEGNYVNFFLPKFEESVSGKIFKKEKIFSETLSTTDMLFADLWRLASVFFFVNDNTLATDLPKELIQENFSLRVGNIRWVFSWYDPFENYTLENFEKNFKLTQVTNGSVYFGREADGALSLYSVDMVGTLTFLHEGEKMTDMLLLPWMLVKFDPEKNKELKDADLLKIMQVLSGDTTLSEWIKRTGMQFQTVFKPSETVVNYTITGLPYDTRKLFFALSEHFLTRVGTIENIKKYSETKSSAIIDDSSYESVVNPTKRLYRKLGGLQIIFSKALRGEMESTEFGQKVVNIIDESERDDLGTQAREIVQQFLIDARFVLFVPNTENTHIYQSIYTETAKILGIVETAGKWKLFQELSRIFSKNLMETNPNNINTDSVPTALRATLTQASFESKDYFDTALYAWLYLGVRENKELPKYQLESSATYLLYKTIIESSQKYANSLDITRANAAQIKIAQEYYLDMLDILVNSLYATYTYDNNGYIAIKPEFLVNDLPVSGLIPYTEMKDMLKVMTVVYTDSIKPKYNSQENAIRILFEGHLARLEGFLTLIHPDSYSRFYKEAPYVVEKNDLKNTFLPKYQSEKWILLTKVVTTPKNIQDSVSVVNTENSPLPTPENQNTLPQGNQDFTQILNTLNANIPFSEKITEKNIEKKGNAHHINAKFQNKDISFIYYTDTAIAGIKISSNIWQIVISDTVTLKEISRILVSTPLYEQRIRQIFQQNPGLSLDNISLSIKEKNIILSWKKFSLN